MIKVLESDNLELVGIFLLNSFEKKKKKEDAAHQSH